VDYVGSYCEKVGERARRTSTTLQTTKRIMKKASDPPMTNDNVVPSKDDNVWVAFDDDFDYRQ
jgi:hypothetical protein